mmetsp:Transcript_1558/g.3153  ORF Transcript_1558/g.3153 Transcript_1558/m.3153 type:complete len:252 (-) Transcript_1558:880-1635(-)
MSCFSHFFSSSFSLLLESVPQAVTSSTYTDKARGGSIGSELLHSSQSITALFTLASACRRLQSQAPLFSLLLPLPLASATSAAKADSKRLTMPITSSRRGEGKGREDLTQKNAVALSLPTPNVTSSPHMYTFAGISSVLNIARHISSSSPTPSSPTLVEVEGYSPIRDVCIATISITSLSTSISSLCLPLSWHISSPLLPRGIKYIEYSTPPSLKEESTARLSSDSIRAHTSTPTLSHCTSRLDEECTAAR